MYIVRLVMPLNFAALLYQLTAQRHEDASLLDLIFHLVPLLDTFQFLRWFSRFYIREIHPWSIFKLIIRA
jgi:hypothetical protein